MRASQQPTDHYWLTLNGGLAEVELGRAQWLSPPERMCTLVVDAHSTTEENKAGGLYMRGGARDDGRAAGQSDWTNGMRDRDGFDRRRNARGHRDDANRPDYINRLDTVIEDDAKADWSVALAYS